MDPHWKAEANYLAGLNRQADKERVLRKYEGTGGAPTTIQPVDTMAAAGNELRPVAWDEVVGQQSAKRLLARIVGSSKARGMSIDHCLFVGPSGTGKTTLANVMALDIGARVFQVEAPIDASTLLELSEAMHDGDILFIDEIHQQSAGDRRGRSSSTNPEVLFSIMEDFTMPTGGGVIQFPRITIIGATTDEGALPDAFINRFPVRPRLEHYSSEDMCEIALRAAKRAGLAPSRIACRIFGDASRGVPREVANFVRNANTLSEDGCLRPPLATEIVRDLFGYTDDGLTPDMQAMLTFMLKRCRREVKGVVVYQASVSSIATAIGKSRDQKAIALRVEPHLIQQGYIQVLTGGRALTDQGVERARQLNDQGAN